LTLAEVVSIHRDQISRYGGASGIRDIKGLLSALAMPAMGGEGQYYHHGLVDMASAYLFHMIQNHPFVDGNKRVGVVAALVFLSMNEVEVDIPEEVLEDLAMAVAQGNATKREVAVELRQYARLTTERPRNDRQ
jgi:death-on-curing protein